MAASSCSAHCLDIRRRHRDPPRAAEHGEQDQHALVSCLLDAETSEPFERTASHPHAITGLEAWWKLDQPINLSLADFRDDPEPSDDRSGLLPTPDMSLHRTNRREGP